MCIYQNEDKYILSHRISISYHIGQVYPLVLRMLGANLDIIYDILRTCFIACVVIHRSAKKRRLLSILARKLRRDLQGHQGMSYIPGSM